MENITVYVSVEEEEQTISIRIAIDACEIV